MGSDCSTIQYLKTAASIEATLNVGVGAGPATSALKIVSDIREYRMTENDVESLNWLVDGLVQNGHGALLSHLQAGMADCAICAALATRMKVRLVPS
jgi:hypothetical protein